jgi:hypothetical protein
MSGCTYTARLNAILVKECDDFVLGDELGNPLVWYDKLAPEYNFKAPYGIDFLGDPAKNECIYHNKKEFRAEIKKFAYRAEIKCL